MVWPCNEATRGNPSKDGPKRITKSSKEDQGRTKDNLAKTIEKDLSEIGYTLQQAREIANNRREWRKIVQSADASCVIHT